MSPTTRRPTTTGRRAGTALAVALTATVLAGATSGCGLFTRSSPTVAAPPVRPGGPTVVLLDPGSQPRRLLRFAPTVGTVSELDLRIDLHLTEHPEPTPGGTAPADAGPAQVIDPPAIHHRIRFTVTGADDDGHDMAFEVVDGGIEPDGTILTDVQIVELTAAIQQVVGLRGRLRLDPRGAVSSISYDAGSTGVGPTDGTGDGGDGTVLRQADLTRQLTSVVPVLPLDPVGRGARWRTTSRSALAGVDVRQTTTYEITAIDGQQVLYRATIAQDAGEQALPVAGAPPARLLATAITGTTSGRFSLDDLTSEHETRLVGSQVLDVGTEPSRRVRQELDLLVSAAPPTR